jgi:signal transduction histidine kinase
MRSAAPSSPKHPFLRRLIVERPLWILGCLSLVALGLIAWNTNRTLSNLVEAQALLDAQRHSELVTEFRSLYTSEVVDRVRPKGIHVVHDYLEHDGAIPLPATLSMLLANRVGGSESGLNSRLYSPYPFPWRTDNSAWSSDFGQRAWAALNADPSRPYMSFEEHGGQPLLRYATADVMRPACVDCHNQHPDSPKRDWRVGDVRGVVEIAVPLNQARAVATAGLVQTATLMAVMVFCGLVFLYYVLRHLQAANAELLRHQDNLETLVRERTRELEASQQQLLTKERLAALGRLTATVSHELRNPLGTIRTTIRSVQSQLDVEQPKLKRMFDRLDRNIVRCVRIIDDLLAYTRIGKLEKQAVELDTWLSTFVEDMQIPAEVELTLDLHARVRLQLDPRRFGQAVQNVVQNAYQSMTQRPEPDCACQLRIAAQTTERRVEVVVTDTGPGVPPEDLEHIFDPLFSTRSFGIGLGLPLVKQILELHDGGVEFESRPGSGCVVTLWLPLPTEEDANAPE